MKASLFQKAQGLEGEADINFGDEFQISKKEVKDNLSDTLRPLATAVIDTPADISLN